MPETTHTPHRMLVTGSAGFIGTNFVHQALEDDRELLIVGLDALTYAGDRGNFEGLAYASRHTFVEGDVCDAPLVAKLLREHGIDTVVHFAAESHVDRSITGPGAFIQTNVVGTFTLLEEARRFWLNTSTNRDVRFHHISTDEVFGSLRRGDPPFHETTRYSPNSPYSASKAAADHLVRAYFHTYKLPVTITNCSNNYGPYQHDEKFIPTVIRACLRGEAIPVYGDGSNIRDWLYVDDHVRAIVTVARYGQVGETYNVGGDNERANIDIVRQICTMMDELSPGGSPHAGLVSFVTDRPGHDWRYAVDASKMRTIGWRPRETFETGLRKTIEWYIARSGDVHRP
jgi:dTDP-glucose 4,6-dehydratase